MSMAELEQALHLVRLSNLADFVGPRAPALIVAAESVLRVTFPPTYRRFVSELGAGAFGSWEFYGVTTDNFTNATVPNGVWLTLYERERFGMPGPWLVVGETGTGEFYVLDSSVRSSEGECPVLIWTGEPFPAAEDVELAAADFGSFFLDGVREVLGLR